MEINALQNQLKDLGARAWPQGVSLTTTSRRTA